LSESDLDLIKHWINDTHVRWGKSAGHKKELGLPELTANTWQATLDRLLMGYAVGNENDFVDSVLPYGNIEGSSALALGGLCDFIQLLFKASDELKRATPLKTWVNRLYYYAEKLLFTHTSVDQLERQQLNEVIEELAGNAQQHTEQVTLEVIVAWMESRISEQKSSTGFLRGQLTFCSMLPMRSIPFKVIALLGLNEGEFPKIDRHPSFDLMGQNFRKGDRSRRTDDRYQFLEILLSARQQLIITYKGLSIRTNNDIAPSVVISELLDVLKSHYQLSDLITKHPLQAFSQQYFIEDSSIRSFSQLNYQTTMSLCAEKPEAKPWWQGTAPVEKLEVININDLFNFFRHPQNYFFQQRLGIRFSSLEDNDEEREPFAIDSLEDYAINQQWIDSILNNTSFSLKKLQAEGRWLSGSIGELEFDQKSQEINQFTDLINQLGLGEKQENLPIDIIMDDYRLIGNLGHLYSKGSLLYRYADLKGKDFIQALLHHLIINQVHAQDTHLLSKDGSYLIPSNFSGSKILINWIDIYLQGQQQPHIFFTEAAFSYVKHVLNPGKSKKPAIVIAKEKFNSEIGYTPSLSQLYQSDEEVSNVLNSYFEEQCNDLLLPAWEKAQK
jgi:exodeoxyribonuclease V gamma subunit